jgi:hypothetical protein
LSRRCTLKSWIRHLCELEGGERVGVLHGGRMEGNGGREEVGAGEGSSGRGRVERASSRAFPAFPWVRVDFLVPVFCVPMESFPPERKVTFLRFKRQIFFPFLPFLYL